MLSRTRIFAAVTLLISCFTSPAVWAQAQNLEAGKSASQLFASTCNACHKSPHGLLKSVAPGSLAAFLREHYTTSSEMASQLASFLVSNGASDTRQAKQGADKQGGVDQADHQSRRNRNTPAQEAARPDDGPPPGEGGRRGHKRLAHPTDPSEETEPANAPAQAAVERAPDGRRSSRQRQSRPAKPTADEPSMANEPSKDEPSRTAEPSNPEPSKAEAPKDEPKEDMGAVEHAKPDADGKSEAAKIEPPADHTSAEKPAVRRDPPAASATAPAAASGGSSEAASRAPPQSPAAASAPQAVTASAPPPASSAGPPVPPTSK
jgi:hypothetical protein